MKFKAKKITDISATPGGAATDALTPNQVVNGTGQTDGLFTQIDAGGGTIGWVLTADLTPVDPAVRPVLDEGFFVQDSIVVERSINNLPATAPWFIAADFLIARAIIETNLTNAGPKTAGSDAVGPLQVSSEEWKAFLANGGALAAPFRPFDPDNFDNWLMQIWGAGYRMFADAKAISAIKLAQQPPVGSASDPFVPSYLDVFHAYLTGSPAAAVAILDANNDAAGQAKPLNTVLTPSLTDPQIAAFFTARSKYTGTIAQPKTVGAFVAAVEADLNDALKKAFASMQKNAPEELMQAKQGEAAWFDVALEEEKKKVDELDPASKPVILGYFNATDLTPKPTSVATPWCGAFAAHCMATSNNPVPTGAAAARSWKSWGVGLPAGTTDIPRGAVIVLSPAPPGTGSTGHVAFFNQFVEGGAKVELLGGNQSNKLIRTPFSVSKIAAIRWIDSAPTTSAAQFGEIPSQTKISDEAFKLILDSEVSSEALYEKKYRGPTWPGFQSGVTIGIGYDIGQTGKAVVEGDWKGVISDPMLTKLLTAVGIKGPPARQHATDLKGQVDVPFAAAIKVHSDRVIPRWVAVVQKALPNTSLLSQDSLGALVSLTYNRGPSFSKSGGRYTEMNNIKAFMASKQFSKIPDEFIKMKRLWPSTSGLATRRDAEAALFRKGLGP
jgi:uncharacterized protein (TIGR02594 family)